MHCPFPFEQEIAGQKLFVLAGFSLCSLYPPEGGVVLRYGDEKLLDSVICRSSLPWGCNNDGMFVLITYLMTGCTSFFGMRSVYQITTTQITVLVCSKLALHICKLAAMLTRQECKLETSLKQACRSDEVTKRRTCSKLATSHCKHSKNRVRKKLRIRARDLALASMTPKPLSHLDCERRR
ncbi:hypothetical protein AVEN_270775-1 [Araneus ventricosus]|uniref:Uncharacterized protein n=1 Tax=Araneus ventricosus TaxID=182803 RepID=A0A4Y2Q0Z6_ARAVE|nr:hypothetical protein AVEN_270775-1 [Araneus ventricosus]